MVDYTKYRHGSGGFADERMINAAGLYDGKNGLFVGMDKNGRNCWSSQQSAVLLCGGARSGKNNFICPWLIDGHYADHLIVMDWKGQLGSIAQLQVRQGRHAINFAPRGERPVKAHKINPFSYLHANSPTLFPDLKTTMANIIPLSGSKNAEFFELTAQLKAEGVAATIILIDGELTLPRLADVMMQYGTMSDEWLAIEEQMLSMPEPAIRQIVYEIQQMRESGNFNSGGYSSVKAELTKAFGCMSDPQLREAVSPPFDFCFSQLTKKNGPSYLVNIMEEHKFAKTSGPVIKALYNCASIYKHRSFGSRPQTWVLDECGNIGSWPAAVGLATYEAGHGIRALFVIQSMAQLNNLAPNAADTILNSCGTQIFMGVRDTENEGQRVSRMLGTATIEYEDFQMNETARIASEQAMMDVIFNDSDAFQAGIEMAKRENMVSHKTKAPRLVLTPDEVSNLPQGTALVFMPGVLERPALMRHQNYWERRDLAGRFLPDPFHPSKRKDIQVQTAFGKRYRNVVLEPVPQSLADWPQYQSGTWSYVEGYRPF